MPAKFFYILAAYLKQYLQMKIAIIGLGPSCPKAKPQGIDIAIGLNDAPEWCDAIVVTDPPRVFTKERFDKIVSHKGTLYTCNPETSEGRRNYSKDLPCMEFVLNPKRHDMNSLQSNVVPQSFTSAIPAIGLAAMLYPKCEIYLYGVDLVNHHSLSEKSKVEMIGMSLRDLSKRIPLYFGALDKDSLLTGCLLLKQPE